MFDRERGWFFMLPDYVFGLGCGLCGFRALEFVVFRATFPVEMCLHAFDFRTLGFWSVGFWR